MSIRSLFLLASAGVFIGGVALANSSVALKITYSLPINSQFHNFRDYDFAVQSATVNDNHLEFTYLIAPDLLGRANELMTMSGEIANDGQFFNLFCGRTGSEASCVSSEGLITCSVLFRNVPVDKEQVKRFIEQKYPNDTANQARLAASHQFEGNPIGTFQIKIDQN